ncbi:MAG: DUF4258 domain-containing protein [Fibromonadales bacterium]|nr:DUF4258 domain-containing protein [Fibromonadales bacterium]
MRLTKHALERMQERRINEAQVLSVLDNAVSIKPSKNSKGVYVATSEIGSRSLKVVFSPAAKAVLTAYWANKNKGVTHGKA